MGATLASIRKARGLSQRELGLAIGTRSGRPIGGTYAQKKIARFEKGVACPTDRELEAIASELYVEIDLLRAVIAGRAPHEAISVIDQIPARSLIASCMLSRPRPQILDDSYKAIKDAVEVREVSIAVFVPYPDPGTVKLHATSVHIQNLLGYYARIRRSVLESNLGFKNSLKPDCRHAVALYFPKAEVLTSTALLMPPVFRQYSLNVDPRPTGVVIKRLDVWTPGIESDASRPVKATGVYSLEEHIDAWESFFGDILPHWVATRKFLDSDAYWDRVIG